MRNYRVVLFPIVVVTILLGVAFALTSVIVGDSARPKRPHSPVASGGSSSSNKVHILSAGLWRTDGNFVSTIRIKNLLAVSALEVTPIIYMADGTPYLLPPAHVAISGVATVDIAAALLNAPASVANHISHFGSAAIMYSYPSPGHVVAQIAAIDTSRSLSFVFPFAEPMGESMQQTLEGLWWKHEPGVSGFVALSNAMDSDTQASVQLVGPANNAQAARMIALPAHSTKMLNLEDLADNPSPLAKRVGGIRVQYTGRPESIQVTGGLENDSEGYSANIPFWMRDMHTTTSTQITYASAGIMVGKPDAMMMPGFPKDTTFSPYLVLRNTTEKPLDVGLQLNYTMGMEGSAPVTRSLPAQHLAPFEATQVDMQSGLNSAGLKNFSGSINLSASFTGKGGDLVLASGSVDQTGSYVFEVEPESIGSFLSKDASYWGVANGNDTMFTLWNPTNAAQDVLVTFHNGDGSGQYKLPVHLAAQASTMIDMAMLIAESKPDSDGHVIPARVREGSAEFGNVKGRTETITIVIAAGIYNVATATCGGGCITCCGASNLGISPNPILCPVGESMPCSSTGVDCHGNTVFPSRWGSDNTSVMTVDSGGNVTGVAPGSANITAYFDNIVMYTGTICGGPTSCPTSNQSGGATATVNPYTQIISTTVSPSTIHATSSPTDANVTVQIYHQDLTGVGDQTVTLEVGTGSSTPPNCTVTYDTPSQSVTLSGIAGSVNPSPTVKVHSPSCSGSASITIQASLSHPSTKIVIKDPNPASSAQATLATTNP